MTQKEVVRHDTVWQYGGRSTSMELLQGTYSLKQS